MAKGKTASRKSKAMSGLKMAGGAAAGAAAGSLIGPLGAAVGAVVGGIAGANADEIAESRTCEEVDIGDEEDGQQTADNEGSPKGRNEDFQSVDK